MIPTAKQIKQAAYKFASKAELKNPDETALHTYTDAAGNSVFWRIRLKNTATREKWIRPFYFDGEHFRLGEPPAPEAGKPLYALHLLATYPSALIWVVEGEKAADALNAAFKKWNVGMDHVATTSGGVSSVRSADLTPLTGRRLVIWPDNCEPGKQYAVDVNTSAQKIAAAVVILGIGNMYLPDKGDAFDWLQREDANFDALMVLLDASRVIAPPEKMPPTPTATEPIGSPKVNEDITLQEEITKLLEMPLLQYERSYKDVAKRLGLRATVLDKQVQAERAVKSEEKPTIFADVEPWGSPVDAGETLSELSKSFQRYAVLPPHVADALALWCAMSWFCEASQIAPLLVIRSPEKGCGKSTVLGIVSRLVYQPLALSGISAAVLFRIADKYRPTVLIDEGDTFLNRENQDMHGIINSGHSRHAPYIWRCVGDDHEPKSFYVFGPKAIAFIGHTRDTLHDRAVEVELRRKLPHEKVSRLRQADGGELDVLAQKLARLKADNLDTYAEKRPLMPESLPDRQADNWEPLLAIAMLAGDEWFKKATEAAVALTRSKEQSVPLSVGVELLKDIFLIIEKNGIKSIKTADLLQALCNEAEAPWSTYNRGLPIRQRQLVKLLADFGIRSNTTRHSQGIKPFRGFKKEQFKDAFQRYCPTSLDGVAENVTTLQTSDDGSSDVTDTEDVTVTSIPSVTSKPSADAGCNDVTEHSDGAATPIQDTFPKPSILRI